VERTFTFCRMVEVWLPPWNRAGEDHVHFGVGLDQAGHAADVGDLHRYGAIAGSMVEETPSWKLGLTTWRPAPARWRRANQQDAVFGSPGFEDRALGNVAFRIVDRLEIALAQQRTERHIVRSHYHAQGFLVLRSTGLGIQKPGQEQGGNPGYAKQNENSLTIHSDLKPEHAPKSVGRPIRRHIHCPNCADYLF